MKISQVKNKPCDRQFSLGIIFQANSISATRQNWILSSDHHVMAHYDAISAAVNGSTWIP